MRGGHEPLNTEYAHLCTCDIADVGITLCVSELKSGVERGMEAGEGGGISGDILSGLMMSSASRSACVPAPAALHMQVSFYCCVGDTMLLQQPLYSSNTCVRT